MRKITAVDVIEILQLQPLPHEGGLFHRTYISNEEIAREHLPPRYTENKPFGSAIYYLLTNDPDSFSALHTLSTDEIYHFYLGDPVELFQLSLDGTLKTTILGQDILNGHQVQEVVPYGVWQGSRLVEGGEWALLGTTMAPGFTNNEFKIKTAEELIQQFPKHVDSINALTRS